jgi:hypothetical protein
MVAATAHLDEIYFEAKVDAPHPIVALVMARLVLGAVLLMLVLLVRWCARCARPDRVQSESA